MIRGYANDLLRSGTNTIADFSGGSYALPDTWQSGDTGFGYTSSDVSVQGSNKFQNNPCPGGTALAAPGCYAPFSQVAPGDIVADSATSQTAGQVFTITNRVTVSVGQAAKNYQTTLTYNNTAVY
jgi:hypothetical protein